MTRTINNYSFIFLFYNNNIIIIMFKIQSNRQVCNNIYANCMKIHILKNTKIYGNVYPCFAPPLSVEDEKLLALEYNNYDILKALPEISGIDP